MKRAACLILVLALGACSGQSIEPRYYLLRPQAQATSAALQPSGKLALGDIHIAPYIDRPGLLLEMAHGEVRAARYHLWAEPIEDGVRAFLGQEISRLSGEELLPLAAAPGTPRITVRIDQLHGTRDGRALLVAYWWVDAGGAPKNAHRFAEYADLASDGYAALAAAEAELLGRLAASIAAQAAPAPRADQAASATGAAAEIPRTPHVPPR